MFATVEIYRTNDLNDVICARSFLDAQGFHTFLRNEHHITQSSGMLALALGGYQIHVIEAEAQEALMAINAARNGEFELADDFDENRTWFA